MNIPSGQQRHAFINALQLSINSKLTYRYDINKNEFTVRLRGLASDKKIHQLPDFLPDKCRFISPNSEVIKVSNLNDQEIEELTSFLLLTRLEPNLIEFFANKEGTPFTFLQNYKKVTKQEKIVEVNTIADAANYIFAKLSEKNMTLRELSDLTGMTPASLHNFKNHQDIKLSTLIKMAKALGVVIRLE